MGELEIPIEPTSQSPVVDQQLANCIKRNTDALGNSEAKLTVLRCPGENIEKLNGLFLYADILELDLSDNNISNITPLYKLLLKQQKNDQTDPPSIKILSIDLANNQLTEANGLFSLPESVVINLNGNPLNTFPKAKNVNVFSSQGKNVLRWDPLNRVVSYKVYVRENSPTGPYVTNFDSINSTRFEHQPLTDGTPYYYEVTGIYRYGESTPTAVVEGIPRLAKAAPQPSPWVKIIDNGGQQLQIDWGEVNDAEHYTIYFKIQDETEWQQIEDANPIFVHSGLIANSTYQYKLRSVNSLGESGDSEIESISVADRPVGLSGNKATLAADPVDGEIVLNWKVVPNAKSQTLYFSTLPYGDIKTAADFGEKLPAKTPPWIHVNLNNNQYFYYLLVTVPELGRPEYTQVRAKPNKRIVELNFSDDNLKDCVDDTGAEYVAELIKLSCIGKQITNLQGIEYLTALAEVNFNRNKLRDISPLSRLPKLIHVSLFNNQIIDITPLEKLASVRFLELRKNNINDITPLSQLSNLEGLGIASNNIVTIDALDGLANLKMLDLSNNAIKDGQGLAQLIALERLDLKRNRIVDILFLTNLTKLQYLDLSENEIINFSILDLLIGLNFISTENNQVMLESFSVGGQLEGLAGKGLVIRLNEQHNLSLDRRGRFVFPVGLTAGENYRVTIAQQPSQPSQLCVANNAEGIIAEQDVNTVSIICETSSTPMFVVGGRVLGLVGTNLTLRFNELNLIAIDENGVFRFSAEYADATDYRVIISQQPQQPAQTCRIDNNEGRIDSQNVQSILVTCDDNLYLVGGTISGLTGRGLVLQNNGTDNQTIAENQSNYIFFKRLEEGESYDVSILRQPRQPTQTCEVSSNTGVIDADNIGNVDIVCTTDSFALGGQVAGLVGSGLVIQNGEQTVNIDRNGSFSFEQTLSDESPYDVSIQQQPMSPAQTCVLEQGQGNMQGTDVSDVLLTCGTDRFAIGGQVNDLLGDGLVLKNSRNDETLSVSSAGTFQFDTLLEDGITYQISVITQPRNPVQICHVSKAEGGVNSVAINDIVVNCRTEQYTIGGTVVNLNAAGLVLQNNDADDLNIDSAGEFQFATPLEDLSQYLVTIVQQPPADTCRIANPSGIIKGNPIKSIVINCDPNSYTVGVTATNVIGQGLILQNNNGNDLALEGDGNFSFTQPIAHSEAYRVSILQQPTSPTQTCQLSNYQGNINAANVTNITLKCATQTFQVGGSVEGLIGTGLVIQNNAQNPLLIDSDGEFNFATSMEDGREYSVTVITHPQQPQQTCRVINGKGFIQSQDTNSVNIRCTTKQFNITGNVTGLQGNGLSLQLNQDEIFTVNKNGSFTFQTLLDDQAIFDVVLTSAPHTPAQSCTLNGANGIVDGRDVASLQVECSTDLFFVKGQISGLSGRGLVLRNNGKEELLVEATSLDFVFPSPVIDGAAYNVEIFKQPSQPAQRCTMDNAVGLIDGANVESINVRCETQTFNVLLNVNGLLGQGLLVALGDLEEFSISQGGLHTYPVSLADLSSIPTLSIVSSPSQPSQQCTVSQAISTINDSDVTIDIDCRTDQFKLAGVISGLEGSGLVLQTSGGKSLIIEENGAFQFVSLIDDGQAYDVSIANHPAGPQQICYLTNGQGTINGADTNINVMCNTQLYNVAVVVTGLQGDGLVLQNNKADDLVVDSQEAKFQTQITHGSAYQVTVLDHPKNPDQTCQVANGGGTVNGDNVIVSVNCVTNQYPVSVSVTGLTGNGLVLQNNGADDLTISGDGKSPFGALLNDGQTYQVTVQTQPSNPKQSCSIVDGSGTISAAEAVVTVNCATDQYPVSVSVTGLTGNGLVLQNNGADDLTISGDGKSPFGALLNDGQAYQITVQTQPSNPKQSCSIVDGNGTISAAEAVITVNCATDQYPVSVSVTGLTGNGLVLQNNGADDLTISGDGKSSFPSAFNDGQTYQVTVQTQPSNPKQSCSIVGGNGTISAAEAVITVNCATDQYPVSVSVTGLTGNGLVLQNNGADDLTISGDGMSPFFTLLNDGQAYQVTIKTQPTEPDQSCSVVEAAGTVNGAEVNVDINCASSNYIAITDMIPTTPSVLKVGDQVQASFEFFTNETDGVDIIVILFPTETIGKIRSPNNNGTAKLGFTVTKELKGNVTAVDIEMFSVKTGQLLAKMRKAVDYQFEGADNQIGNQANSITNIQFSPPWPALLSANERVKITFEYQTDHAAGVKIWARPFTQGKLTPNYAASESPVLPTGKGKGSQNFTITSGSSLIDQIQFEMWTPNQEIRLMEQFETVGFQYQAVLPRRPVTPPVTLPITPPILIDPVTRPITPPILIDPVTRPITPPILIDPVTLPITPPILIDPLSMSLTVFPQNGLTNITLNPVSGTHLLFGESINLTFDYEIADPQGAYVIIRPMANYRFIDNVRVCDITVYPVGTGSGVCDVSVLGGNDGQVLDTIQLQLINAAGDTVLFEQNRPVNYLFRSNSSGRLKQSPSIVNNRLIDQPLSEYLTVYPPMSATNVPRQTYVVANFSQPIDTLKATSETITMQGPTGLIGGILEVKDDSLLFIPSVPLVPATQYQVTMETVYEATSEFALTAPYQWSFVTATQPTSIYQFSKLSTNLFTLIDHTTDNMMLYPDEQSMLLNFNVQHVPPSVTGAALSFSMKTLDPFGEGGIISVYHFTAKQVSGLTTAWSERRLIKSFMAPNTSESINYSLDITEWLNQANTHGQPGIGFYLDIVLGSDRYQIPLAQTHDRHDQLPMIRYIM